MVIYEPGQQFDGKLQLVSLLRGEQLEPSLLECLGGLLAARVLQPHHHHSILAGIVRECVEIFDIYVQWIDNVQGFGQAAGPVWELDGQYLGLAY